MIFARKLYLMEPLCQTQMPADGQNASELLHQIETQETKVLEAEQRCRKLTNDLQKVEFIDVLHDYFRLFELG